MGYQNCWEFTKCGREPGGSKVDQFGVCPAAKETRADGINCGKNGGRVCWLISGTFCEGKIQGSFASKLSSCEQCDFYKKIQPEECHSSDYDCKSLSWLLSPKKTDKIITRIMAPIAIALTLLLIISILTGYWFLNWKKKINIQHHTASVEQLFPTLIEEEAKLISCHLSYLQNNTALQQAWLQKDRDVLLKTVQPIFDNLHNNNSITHFYFHNIDQHVFLRVHNPEKYGDLITRYTLQQASKTSLPVTGLEFGPLGTFTLRVVYPWLIDGKLSGFLELGKEIGHITPKIKEALTVDLLIVIDKNLTTRAAWEKRLKMTGHGSEWDTTPHQLIIDSTMESIPLELSENIIPNHVKHHDITFDVSHENKTYHGCFLPLIEAGGRYFGDFIVLIDVTNDIQKMKKISFIFTGGHLFLFLMLFGSFYFYLSRIKQSFIESNNIVSHEISERLLMENELRKANEFLKKVIHSSVDGIIAADMKGNIIIFNEGAENLLGYRAEEVLNRVHMTKLYPPGMAKEIMRRLRGSNQDGHQGKLTTTPTTLITKSKEQIPVNISAAIVYEGEEEVATVGIFTDLRERKQMQDQLDKTYRQLLQSEKLSSIGILAAGVAHEINNPLNNISTSCQILIEELSGLLPREQFKRLEWIEDHVTKARDIVRALLEFSREHTFECKPVNFHEVTGDVLRLLKGEIPSQVEIQLELPDELILNLDKTRMEQAFMNLIMNSIHSMDNGGTLLIRGTLSPDSQEAILEVCDTGEGVPKEHLPHIFDPFFTTKPIGKGTGLGLSLTHDIIERHGGTISVKSEVGVGTKFTIILPLSVPV